MQAHKLKYLIVAVVMTVVPDYVVAQQVSHPLNALNADEVASVVAILKRTGQVDSDTLFTTIRLLQPPKADIWQWQPGKPFSRKSKVVFRRGAKTFEAVVNISSAAVISVKEKPGVQSSVLISEWRLAQSLTMKDAKWQAAMRARGYEDFSRLSCSPIAPGYLPGVDYGDRRVLNVPCFEASTSKNLEYGRPVEGVYAVVDVNARAVIDVVDTGIVPGPKPVANEDNQNRNTLRPALKPVINISPGGPNFKLKGGLEVDWQNWSFHLRFERRNGIVISLVRYNDKGNQRKVAYQMSLSEMFVPYMDPNPGWSYKAFLDAGEYGLGYLASSLRPGQDCPRQAVYINTIVPSDTGKVFSVERAMCIFERATGDPAWRHGEDAGRKVESRRSVELVVRMIPTIGNYDYTLDWVFTQTAEIKLRAGATGIVAIKGVKSASMNDKSAAKDTEYGTLVAPNSVAPFHDHYFSYRLDLDVDGINNTFTQGKITPKTLPPDNPRRSIWTFRQTPVTTESALGRQSGTWYIKNPNRQTKLGYNPSLQITMGNRVTSPLPADQAPQSRAAFSTRSLWITKYKAQELYAAGDFPNQSKGGAGLPAWIASPQNIINEDIVVWPTIGFHHIPRSEDWPMMPTLWREVTIRPFNFFDQNPAIDLNPDFARLTAQKTPVLRPGKAE
jgi:primary-amine oxidase